MRSIKHRAVKLKIRRSIKKNIKYISATLIVVLVSGKPILRARLMNKLEMPNELLITAQRVTLRAN